MKLLKQGHFVIKTKLSQEEIYKRLLDRNDVKTFDVDIYFNMNSAQKFGEQKLRESLSINGVPAPKTSSFHIFKGEFRQNQDHNEIQINIHAGSPQKLFFLVWGGLCGVGCLISILALIFVPTGDIEQNQTPLFFFPFVFLIFGYIIIQVNIGKNSKRAIDYFTKLFEGF